MRRMLVSRISRRVLAEHHLALTQGLTNQEKTKGKMEHVGIIFTGLSVKRSLDKFIRFILAKDGGIDRLRQDYMLQGLNKLPEVIIDGEVDAKFSYIREHLEYILLELLLNVSAITSFLNHRLLSQGYKIYCSSDA